VYPTHMPTRNTGCYLKTLVVDMGILAAAEFTGPPESPCPVRCRRAVWLSDNLEMVESDSLQVTGSLHVTKGHSISMANVGFHRSLFNA